MSRTVPKVSQPTLLHAIHTSADPHRARVGFEHLLGSGARESVAALAPEPARIVAAVFAGSVYLGQLLARHPEWVESVLGTGQLARPRAEPQLRRELNSWLPPALATRDYAGAFARLREFKEREMLRIAARDLARLGDASTVTREISNLADLCLDAALQLCRQPLVDRLGQPWHQDADGAWLATRFAVLGLGKLGGQELNYSSDVDLMFLYSEEGHVAKAPPRRKTQDGRVLSNHQFFKRLAEAFIAEVTRSTPEGMLYRVDVRLRPEGDTGPLVRSLAGYEDFYAQWGQTWERMMLIKTRGVAGDAALAAEFLEMVQPFRYPRSLGEGALREIATMKTRLETEIVRTGELDRNVKLGRGGIREIEFVAQTAQLLQAGRIPFLQGAQTLPTLRKLAEYKLLSGSEAEDLERAYCFLREVEHRVQMENNLQTHTIPPGLEARGRLARLMGCARLAGFDTTLKRHTRRVRAIYEKLVHAESRETGSPHPKQFRGAEAEWRKILIEHGFKDADQSFRLLNEFAHGPGYVHVSQRTTELALQLIPRLLAICPGSTAKRPARSTAARLKEEQGPLSDPDRVLARLDSFISAYGARAVTFETWTSHPQLFELWLLLFDRSEFLAEIAIRTPDLVDELVLTGRLGRSKGVTEILKDLRHGLGDADQRLWIRRYHQAEFMRIGLRSILGLADHEQNFLELTALADACLSYALEAITRRRRLKAPPFAIIGLGKLGGQELTYGSDLDLLFVTEAKEKRNLPRLQHFAIEMMDLLQARTELGSAFVIDARLRPDGEKGLLVNTLVAYEDYYRQRAQLWEIQALTRARAIAGDPALGESYRRLAASLTHFAAFTAPNAAQVHAATPAAPPACFTPDWKQQIARMRERIEKERTPAGLDALAFKTGSGGLIEAEFIAQTLCLQHGWQEPNTLRALERARNKGAIARAQANKLIENYRQLRRLESILRRWSFAGETVLPTDPAAYARVAVRCGFPSPDAFRDLLAQWRRAIREIYRKVFAG